MSSTESAPDDKTRIIPKPGATPPKSDAADEATTIVPRPRPGGTLNQQHMQVPLSGVNTAKNPHPESTRIRPRPRQATALPSQLHLHQMPHPENTPPLLKTLGPLLAIVPELRRLDAGSNVAQLQSLVVSLVDRVQQGLNEQIERPTLKKDASYVVCALIDETALNSPWGEQCHWAQTPLLSRFHQETYGGERVFDLIEKCLAQPRQYPEMLELLYLSLSLGFMGKFRLDPDGNNKIAQYRSDIYNALPEQRKANDGALSESIKPTAGLRNQLQSFMPAWIYAATLMLIAFGVFSFLSFGLNTQTDALRHELAALVPSPERALLPNDNVRKEVIQLRNQLAVETRQGAVAVNDYTTHTEIVLSGEALFASGSADIAKSYHPILFKISKVLADIPGRIVVAGHTDDLSIRTPQFPSNWHLSLARAGAVVSFLEQSTDFSATILPEGRGASVPMNNNDNNSQRAQNRRVVIEIYYGGTP